ncbi:hypothetical protein ACFFNY_11195 [Paenibacillus hodogayensis]|uniref:Uncharacterized protein n=1 Tax=Paenibacillus hodogayensis TaxID=279208 RepID=A0ABV5VVB5_9BACL
MLVRIFFDNRWIPVNLPDNSYSEAAVELLLDRLTQVLTHAPHRGSAGWADLQMIELETSPDGWRTTLYLNETAPATETLYFR